MGLEAQSPSLRGLFVCPISADLPGNRGILNKMESERAALAYLAGHVDVVSSGTRGPLLGGERFADYPLRAGALSPVNHYFLFYRYVWRHCRPFEYDFLYVRYPLALPSLLAFLRAAKRARPSLKIILEVPTFPYRSELRTPKQRVLLALDDLGHGQLHRYVDLVVTFFGQNEIYGIPCFRTENGIDVNRIRLAKNTRGDADTVKMIAVANLARWHGLDRILRGVALYERLQNHPRVNLDIVGDGPVAGELRTLVEELGLGESVSFHGTQSGEALDTLFDEADVAVGSLGMHRIDLARSSSLKSREYCARGLPFVLASEDPDFPEGTPFIHRVESDESVVDVSAIVSFFHSLEEELPDYSREMREYAEERLTWRAKLAPVIEYVRTGVLPP
ncbi:MAG: glycosyltransferase [Myxococcota bacterium]